MRRLKQEQRDAGQTRDAGLTAGSICFRRLVRKQSNRPRACQLGAVGAGAEQKRRTGGAIKRGNPTGSCAGVPAVFQWHTCVSRGSSTREQENPEVRGGDGIASRSGSIVSSHGPRHPTVLTPRGSLNRYHHESPRRLLLRPSSTHYNHSRQTPSSSTESRHRRAFLFADPIAMGLHFPLVLLHNQGLP
jgi:hypothetical protein